MIELAFPIATVVFLYLISVPVLTVVISALLRLWGSRIDHAHQMGSSAVWLRLGADRFALAEALVLVARERPQPCASCCGLLQMDTLEAWVRITITSRRLCLIVALLVPSTALAQTPTIEQVLEQVDADPVLRAAVESPVDHATAEASATTRYPGPSVGARVRWVFDVEQEVEVEAGQAIPLDGVRSLKRDARLASADALERDGAARVLGRKAEVAARFYRVVRHRERVEVLTLRRDAVERARASLDRREEAGDVSAFELERMEREVRRAEIAISREMTSMDVALGELAAVVGTKPYDGVEGELRPAACGGARQQLPQFEAIVHRIEATEFDREAAARRWIPMLQTSVGWVGLAEGSEFNIGVFGGLGLAFPFWAYGDFAEDAQSARIVELNTEQKLLRRETDALAATYAAQCEELLGLAEDSARSVEASQKLLERAEAGYAAAELSLLELVDAQSALLEDRLQHLQLLGEARAAQNAWINVTGGWR